MGAFCEDHWNRLRAKIEERGLNHLIPPSGIIAAEQQVDQINRADGEIGQKETLTPANFDPLMMAHWSIYTNVMELIANAGMQPLYLMGDGPEDLVKGYGPKYAGRTWSRCPLCYIGLAHEVSCKDRRCRLPKVDGYAWMLDRAADEAKKKAEELGLVGGT